MPPGGGAGGQRKLLADLTRAAETQKRVHMTYVSDRGELTERAVDPYAVLFRAGEWSLVGHCHLRDDQRTFRVDRIRGVKRGAAAGDARLRATADWSLAQVLRRSPWVFWRAFRGRWTSSWTSDPSGRGSPTSRSARTRGGNRLPGGWVRVSFRSGNPDYVVTRVLDAGGQLRLVQPAELRDRVLRDVRGGDGAVRARGADIVRAVVKKLRRALFVLPYVAAPSPGCAAGRGGAHVRDLAPAQMAAEIRS